MSYKAPGDGVIVFVPDKDGSRCPVFLPNNPPRVDHRLLASDMLVWQVLRDRVPVEFARSVGIDSHHAQYWVISSPNVDYIPEPIMGPRTVVARLDGRYAADDRTQWPQFYVHGEEWLAAMPRPQPNKYKRGYWLQHTLCLEDTERVDAGVVAVDLRKVKQTIFGHVLQHHLAVFNTARHYAQTVEKDVMSGWRRRCLALHLVPLENLRGRIESFALPWKDLVLAFAEWQRNILDLHAFLRYSTEIYPAVTSLTEKFEMPSACSSSTADRSLMGCFTFSVAVAENMVRSGIPVWLIRPAWEINSTMWIGFQTQMVRWKDALECHVFQHKGVISSYPILYRGEASSDSHWRSMKSLSARATGVFLAGDSNPASLPVGRSDLTYSRPDLDGLPDGDFECGIFLDGMAPHVPPTKYPTPLVVLRQSMSSSNAASSSTSANIWPSPVEFLFAHAASTNVSLPFPATTVPPAVFVTSTDTAPPAIATAPPATSMSDGMASLKLDDPSMDMAEVPMDVDMTMASSSTGDGAKLWRRRRKNLVRNQKRKKLDTASVLGKHGTDTVEGVQAGSSADSPSPPSKRRKDVPRWIDNRFLAPPVPPFPPQDPIWVDARSAVDRDWRRVKPSPKIKVKWHFPDPIFLAMGGTNSEDGDRKHRKVVLHYMALAQAWFAKVRQDPDCSPSSMQPWRWLLYGLFDDTGDSKDAAPSTSTLSAKTERLKRLQSAARDLFHPNIKFRPLPDVIQWQGLELDRETVLENGIPQNVMDDLIWLTVEAQWRFELRTLDCCLAGDEWTGHSESDTESRTRHRDAQVAAVFNVAFDWSGDFEATSEFRLQGLIPIEIPSIDISVAGDCNDQHTHHALLQLAALMRSWPNCPPSIRDLSIITDVESMKTDIARFYCQAFFDEFGRAPVLPCRVIPRSTPPPSRSPTPVPRSPSQSIEPDVDDAPLDLAPSDEAPDDSAAARTAGAASPKECDSPLLPVGTPSDPSDPNARVVRYDELGRPYVTVPSPRWPSLSPPPEVELRPAAASSPAIPASSPAAATSSPATAASSPAAAASSPAAAVSSPAATASSLAAAASSPAATASSPAAAASSPAVPASLPAAVPLPVVTVPSPAAAVSLLAAVVPSDEQPEDQGPANMDLPTADKSPSPQSDMYLYDMQGRPLGPATIVPESIEDDMVVEETASKKRTRKTKSSAKGKGKAIVRTDRVLRSSHQSDANVPLVLSNSFSEVIDISDDESIDIDFQRPSDLGNDTEELPTLTSSTGVKNHLQRAPARASARKMPSADSSTNTMHISAGMNKMISNMGVVKTKFGIQLTDTSLRRLLPGAWLDDELVNFFAAMCHTTKAPDRAAFMSSFYLTKFLKKNQKGKKVEFDVDAKDDMSRWWKKMERPSRMVLPMHDGNHWRLIHVSLGETVGCVCIYDSLTFHRQSNYLKTLADGVIAMLEAFLDAKGWAPITTWEIDVSSKGVPYQLNSCDCGVYIILYMYTLRGSRVFDNNQLQPPFRIPDNAPDLNTQREALLQLIKRLQSKSPYVS